ncbi:MAG: phosphate--acyl-ACP acyltransferase [SAR324 cluster bacterium]|uniref:Phosphate acyltransferase n=1 Tax=SAR324 cluster bacterium TaxID=2024889 RepID=A0A2A4T1F2_9DELT|nr:MAG: phosphate--acyl-ACP acyltransferase [SAR324 cluster bacterium]
MAIAVDVMGGDLYPQNPIHGAIKAVNEKNIDVVLVGDESCIKKELDRHSFDSKKVEIVHATQVIAMDEPIASAMRSKRDSSMRVCFNLHKKKEVSGVVSAGSSGAMLAIGRFVLKTIPGIDRPCISALLPSIKDKKVLLVDAGANMDCSPQNLFQFAILGDVYMRHILSVENPAIGLLNIGSEEGKGDERSKHAYSLLKDSSLNFTGNIEGKDFFKGNSDVVVTDGFAGNVLLKSVQGAASYIKAVLEEEIKRSKRSLLGALLMKPAFRGLKKRSDYAEFGGAPLLGLRGNAIVCHGGSNPEALLFGINFAHWAAEAHLVERMEEKILEFQDTLSRIQG